MKFYEKRHYSQKYVFSDALEEDYKLQLGALYEHSKNAKRVHVARRLTRQLRLGSKRNQYGGGVTKAETCAFLRSPTWHYYRL